MDFLIAHKRGSFIAAFVLFELIFAQPSSAKVWLTTAEALAQAFSNCEVKKTTTYLTDEQVTRIESASQTKVSQKIVWQYQGLCGDQPVRTAYFDTQLVRTLPQTIFVVIGPSNQVDMLEVINFDEPSEYLAPARWLKQFLGKFLNDNLALNRDIQGITGATLTSRATTDAVRRVLAIHQELNRP